MLADFKIIIVGGGVAGCSAALFLHKVLPNASLRVYEAYSSSSDSVVGAAISLGTNGLCTLALVASDAADDIYGRSHKVAFHEMRDCDGEILGRFPAGKESESRTYGTVMVRRWVVHDALLTEMRKKGLKVTYGKRMVAITEGDEHVEVQFADGTTDVAHLLIRADGIHSAVRHAVFPTFQPVYSGLAEVGGFLPRPAIDPAVDKGLFPPASSPQTSKGAIMTFGPLGFFGFSPVDEVGKNGGGQYIWWSTFEAKERSREEWKNLDEDEMKAEVTKRHSKWYSPIPQIISGPESFMAFPIYELSDLPTWHTRRTVLIGDAAHVMPPHSGQGVSQAIEDAAALVLALKSVVVDMAHSQPADASQIEFALAAFQQRRKSRV